MNIVFITTLVLLGLISIFYGEIFKFMVYRNASQKIESKDLYLCAPGKTLPQVLIITTQAE